MGVDATQPRTGAQQRPGVRVRPPVDVVVPFRGSAAELTDVVARMRALSLRAGDTLTVIDNSPHPSPGSETVLPAPARQSSYFARNRGAARGAGEWIAFLDADVTPPPDLLDRLFDPPPGERTGVLAGGICDEQVATTPAARYAARHAAMSQDNTLQRGRFAYAQTANAAVRRAAFEAIGGFTEDVRSGGDADLCFRLRAAGWELESRPDAAVIHRNRTSLRALARQRARHGAGVAWLDARFPGSFPRQPRLRWTAHKLAQVARRREPPSLALVALVYEWSFALGRLLPNQVGGRS